MVHTWLHSCHRYHGSPVPPTPSAGGHRAVPAACCNGDLVWDKPVSPVWGHPTRAAAPHPRSDRGPAGCCWLRGARDRDQAAPHRRSAPPSAPRHRAASWARDAPNSAVAAGAAPAAGRGQPGDGGLRGGGRAPAVPSRKGGRTLSSGWRGPGLRERAVPPEGGGRSAARTIPGPPRCPNPVTPARPGARSLAGREEATGAGQPRARRPPLPSSAHPGGMFRAPARRPVGRSPRSPGARSRSRRTGTW